MLFHILFPSEPLFFYRLGRYYGMSISVAKQYAQDMCADERWQEVTETEFERVFKRYAPSLDRFQLRMDKEKLSKKAVCKWEKKRGGTLKKLSKKAKRAVGLHKDTTIFTTRREMDGL